MGGVSHAATVARRHRPSAPSARGSRADIIPTSGGSPAVLGGLLVAEHPDAWYPLQQAGVDPTADLRDADALRGDPTNPEPHHATTLGEFVDVDKSR